MILREYGWVAVILLWLLPRAWQFATDKLYPAQVDERQKEQARKDERERAEHDAREKALQAEREARATLIRAQIEREDKEADRRLKLEERMVTALEQMSLGISVGNERIAAMISSQTSHHNYVFGSHVELKEKMEQIQEMVSQKNDIAVLREELRQTQRKIKPASTGRTSSSSGASGGDE